jgi:GntR family transcriptional regulator, transcriptional repressor for pyruvate dehydrogenase complex
MMSAVHAAPVRQDDAAALAALRHALGRRRGRLLDVPGAPSAYEQIAERLQELVLSGLLQEGTRLPTEATLAAEFGVSRATVREAVRMLGAQGLVLATKGARGGTYVTRPSLDFASRLLQANVALLTEIDDITLEELLEARRLIEVPAARLAARRRTEEELARLAEVIPDDQSVHGAGERFGVNAGFHTLLMATSGNALLEVAALPIFTVLQTSLARSGLGTGFARRIDADHREIADAIARADEDGAGEAMDAHLDFLQPHYRRVWRRARERRPRA